MRKWRHQIVCLVSKLKRTDDPKTDPPLRAQTLEPPEEHNLPQTWWSRRHHRSLTSPSSLSITTGKRMWIQLCSLRSVRNSTTSLQPIYLFVSRRKPKILRADTQNPNNTTLPLCGRRCFLNSVSVNWFQGKQIMSLFQDSTNAMVKRFVGYIWSLH